MRKQGLCILFNTNSDIIEEASKKAAQNRNCRVISLKSEDFVLNKMTLTERIDLFKKELKKLSKEKLRYSKLICLPKKPETLITKYDTSLNYLLNHIAICVAYAQRCKKLSDNRILIIGSVKGYDYIKVDKNELSFKSMFNEIAELTHETQLDGSINMVTKFLALNLAQFDVKVNAAMFGPIQGVDDEETIQAYSKKAVSGLPIKLEDISDSLDIFLDPENTYMTGQVVKFDGGVSIW